MATHPLLIFLSFLVFQAIPERSLADDFKLVKREHSISLYERWIAHNGNLVRELKAEFTVRAGNPESLAKLLRNEPEGRAWNSNASIYRVLPGSGEDSWLTYIRYDAPWPMNDYDCLLSYRYQDSPQGPGGRNIAEISFKSTMNERFPLSESITRITGTRGKWLLEEQNGGLKVIYLVTTDRSRKIPRWVSDPIVHENLFRTMTRFKDLLEK